MAELESYAFDGLVPYTSSQALMRQITEQRAADDPDQLWFLQHPATFTQGQAGQAEHILAAGDIPVVQSDRGGQVTYHGSGQLVGYCLVNLDAHALNTRAFVEKIEGVLIELLREFGVEASGDREAPGVYVDQAKIASLGFRVKRGKSYHGFSLNLDMDLAPFSRINPCGYAGMEVCQLKDLTQEKVDIPDVIQRLVRLFNQQFNYTGHSFQSLNWDAHERRYQAKEA